MPDEISIYERFGRAIEREQQNAEALTAQIEKTKAVAKLSSQVLSALKDGSLRLDQIEIDKDESWRVLPDRPAPEPKSD